MLIALILLPTLAALAAFAIRADRLRRALLVAVALGHSTLTALAWRTPPTPVFGGWLALDALGLLFLALTSGLFLLVAIYSVGYLVREPHDPHRDFEENAIFTDAPEARFVACLLFFLASMTVVTASQHLGVIWVAVEATTLASAPLIAFHRHHRSLEATWKYLLICSVGIALALLGTFFLGVAAARLHDGDASMVLADLLAGAGSLQPSWLKAAFILLLVGYGTKMGLAPLHTWLPDAHAEAPSVVSALLSGALLNCAFLAILRAQQIVVAAGHGEFSRKLLVALGLVSLAMAVVFIIRQTDFKRLLAYSSVEHMGIMALGVGLGGVATGGALLHAVNHTVAKGMLFLVAGNILALVHTKAVRDVRGLAHVLPISGALWLAGLLAITGSPPFGTFLSELTIARGAFEAGRFWVGAAYLVGLAAAFIGMGRAMLGMVQGEPAPVAEAVREPALAVAPALVLVAVSIVLGLWLPEGLVRVLEAGSALLGGRW
jgi:hydrogenase-4 component F